MTTYTNAVAMLRGRESKKIGNNTYARLTSSGAVAIRLHDTDVVTVLADGAIVLDSGGWRTPTTKDRINSVLECLFGSRYDVPFDIPFSVWRERNVWYVVQYIPNIAWRELPRYKFADGLTISADGVTVSGAAEDDKRAQNKLTREIKNYCAAYINAFMAGDVPAPGAGDCWYCAFCEVDTGLPIGEVLPNNDHMASHMAEGYFVPSLLARAIELFPVSPAAMWIVSDKWAGTNNNADDFAGDIARAQLGSALRRYVRRCFALA